ncbi:MAG: hypothetical protein CL389_13075 [Acidiferrobacteraceae bacterium]|jgi:predicted enzyme related to lactoylglutathione lyase|nr:hypothetical protein [Acidiferrobacteraceae bacterium]|tara:strand:+ start:1454 stop:1813 length:360 start_codon:yes stop_codon:yes gene_type:complete
MKFDGVMLFCEDIRELTRFYEEVMLLERDSGQTLPPHRFVTLLSDGAASLCLHSGTKPNGGRAKLMFTLNEIRPLFERLRAYGHRVRQPKNTADATMTFDFKDPEGNRIQVYGPWSKDD